MLRLYTDGSYGEATGVGSWAWVLVDGRERARASGVVSGGTTHQRMELLAVAEGLAALPPGVEICVVSDSTYVIDAMTRGLPLVWRENGWRSIGHDRSVVNRDLWERLLDAGGRLYARFTWVKAHNGEAGDRWNVAADQLARRTRQAAEAQAA